MRGIRICDNRRRIRIDRIRLRVRTARVHNLERLSRDWEHLARVDACWAVCSDPDKRGNRWSMDELLDTGEREIATVLNYVQELGIFVDLTKPVLDFGCGVGRLTQALGARFAECHGVDISRSMLELARRYNRRGDKCRFHLNQSTGLPNFSDGFFGFVYSSIVLQHMERLLAESYIAEFCRILKSGGVLVFQVPEKNVYRTRLAALSSHVRGVVRIRTRLRALFQIQEQRGRMEMHGMSERAVRRLLEACKMRIVDIRLTNSTRPDFNGALRYLQKPPREGWISKQYCAVRL